MPIGELRRGSDLIRKSAESSGGGRYTPFITWGKDETKTVYFVTPLEEMSKVLMHQFVRKVVEDEDGDKRDLWLTFMCRKDAAWQGESHGKCQLCDEINHKATERFVALAVELEPEYDADNEIISVKVKYRTGTNSDGAEVEYPQVGLVIQSARIFFTHLAAWDQKRPGIVERSSWEISSEGEKTQKQYHFFPVKNIIPDVDSIKEFIPSLESVLENLGSLERYNKELEGVRAEDQPKFGDDKKKKPSRNKKTAPSEDTETFFAQMQAELEKKKKKEDLESY